MGVGSNKLDAETIRLRRTAWQLRWNEMNLLLHIFKLSVHFFCLDTKETNQRKNQGPTSLGVNWKQFAKILSFVAKNNELVPLYLPIYRDSNSIIFLMLLRTNFLTQIVLGRFGSNTFGTDALYWDLELGIYDLSFCPSSSDWREPVIPNWFRDLKWTRNLK